MVCIKNSSIHGKGVFALNDIPKDTILTCDVLETADRTLLIKYLFIYKGKRRCIHVGWASYLNSSYEPNLEHLKVDTELNLSYFKVIKPIKKDKEITLSY